MSVIETIHEVSEENLGSSSDEDDTHKVLEHDASRNCNENNKEMIDDLEEFIDNCVQKNLSIEKHMSEETDEHETIDLNKTVYCKDPLVFTIDNYLTDEECDHFINISIF
jgi:hypothetical protein